MGSFTDNPLAACSDEELADEMERRRLGGTGSEHIVTLLEDTWTIKHPIRCRISGGDLDQCPLHVAMSEHYPPSSPESKSDPWPRDTIAELMLAQRGTGMFAVHPPLFEQLGGLVEDGDVEAMMEVLVLG